MSRFKVGVFLALGLAFAVLPASAKEKESELVDAVKSGSPQDLEKAFIHGANPNEKTADGVPVLFLAAKGGNPRVTQFLVEKGARIDLAEPSSGATPLQVAADQGNTDCVGVLLSHKANPNTSDHHGETALMKSARHGASDIVRMLIRAGADVNMTEFSGRTALSFAREARLPGMVQILRDAGGTE